MTLKVKLVSAIAAFIMVLGIFIVAVLAANNASVNLGGSLSFDAKDVVAHVTGSATGAQINPQNLDVTYSSGDTVGDETVWEDLNLNFIDHRTAIVFSFTVENLSTERSLTLTFTDNLEANANIEKEVLRDGAAYTSGAQVQLDAKAEGITTNKTSFTVEFRVADGDTSFSGVTFDYLLNLYDESAVPVDYTGFTFETSGTSNEATLTSYTGTAANLVIPSTFSIVDGEYVNGNDYTVTAIADGDMQTGEGVFTPAAQTLQSVVLPDTLKTIGDCAFTNCDELTSVTISKGATGIGQVAFGYCSKLISVIIPEGVTSIGMAAFSYCSSLTSIELPTSVTSIGQGAFAMSGLTEVAIPDGVTSIENMTFTSCLSLTKVTIPQSVISIGQAAFAAAALIEVTIPANVVSIAESTFAECTSLTTVYIDSPTVAGMLVGKYEAEYLIYNATTVYVSESAVSSLPAEFANMFNEISPSDQEGYRKYTLISQ